MLTRNVWGKFLGKTLWFLKDQYFYRSILPMCSTLYSKQSDGSYLCTICLHLPCNPICNKMHWVLSPTRGYSILNLVSKWQSYGLDLPLWVHQCQELKINMSIPLHASPFRIESSLRTRPTFCLSKSTRYCVRYNSNFSP